MHLKDIIKGANVLFVPVLSMRSYENGLYKLNCDGNMARVLSLIYKSGIKKADIMIPDIDRLLMSDFYELNDRLVQKGLDTKISFIHNKCYGNNAYETRKALELLIPDVNYNSYDYIITEPQEATIQLILNEDIDNDKLIYWCVASETVNYSPWFTKEFKDSDKWIANNITTICATQSQVDFLKGKSVKDTFYDAKFSDMKIIFFPFRLSDPSYQWGKFRNMIKRLRKENVKNFEIIVTDPNNSLDEDIKRQEGYVHVDSCFPVYISILKGKPIIPYFENADEIKHISIEEMIMYKCNIICYNNTEIPNVSNVLKVSDDEEFYQALKRLILK